MSRAKSTAFLCDNRNWEQYKSSGAKYAVGGPTFEIMIASIKKVQVKELDNIIEGTTNEGYKGSGNITNNDNKTFYSSNSSYWIASPTKGWDSFALLFLHSAMYSILGQPVHTPSYVGRDPIGLRPVVCLPASAIEVVGEGENAVLNYK